MAETKYGKYFIIYEPKPEERIPTIVRFDDNVLKGSNFYHVHWTLPGQTPAVPGADMGHPPHMHKDAEILMFIGTDPNNPMDLGAECELCMGSELEKHMITKTSVVYIPPNLIHCPFKVVKTVRPWIMIRIFQGPVHTEKFCPEVLPKEVRDKIDWSFWKRQEEGF